LSNWPLVQIVHRPGVLDLAWGHPDPSLLPLEAVQRAARRALDDYGSETLQYGHPAGPGPLRAWLADHLGRLEGRAPDADEVLITAGISHGLDLLLHHIAAPGDTVLVESPTYHLAVRILRDQGLRLAPAVTDEHGLRVDALRETLAGLRRKGRRAKALYLVPTFNNPTGVSLPLERRQALVEVAAREKMLIVEDDVYRELAYDGPAPPSLWSLAPEGVVARLGSFAKTLAPGLRVGWLTGPRDIVAALRDGGLLDSGGGISHFAGAITAALCAAGDYEAHVSGLRAAYGARRDALHQALEAHLPAGSRVTRPGGGFFVWVRLPEAGPSAAEALAGAEALGVSYLPGERFYLDGQGARTLRLAFSLYAPEELREAARRLGQAWA
jgi:2-aminoadipate transaminase